MRIRTVKPEFFTHAGLFDAEQETKLPLRVGFVGLWCACDREGRFKWEPCRLGVMILPYDGLEFSRVLDALVTRGFVVKYRVEGSWFGAVISFKAHQVINNRESASVLPDVSEAEEVIQSDNTHAPRVNDACSTPLMHAPAEGKGIWKGNNPPRAPTGGSERKENRRTPQPLPRLSKLQLPGRSGSGAASAKPKRKRRHPFVAGRR